MDTKKIITACQSVLQSFDGLTDEGEFKVSRDPNKMHLEFWNDLSGFNEMTNKMDGEPFDKWLNVMRNHAALAFATGYCLGQMFDLTGKDVLEDVNIVKKAIKEEALLPYFPRKTA